LSVVILAAGEGKRMHSALPKVLQPLGGQPLLEHVLAQARCVQPERIVVVHGHGGDDVCAVFPDPDLAWAHQAEQRGTGHALAQALPALAGDGSILVLCGDVPLITAETLQALLAGTGEGVGLLTVQVEDPTGYGRIVRGDDGGVLRIVEHRDASAEELELDEINTGIMVLPGSRLAGWLSSLSDDNAQGELYLTDVIAAAVADGVSVTAVLAEDPQEVLGVNDRAQLAEAEAELQRRRVLALMDSGVTALDPVRLDIRGEVRCGRDVVLDVNVILEGEVELGDGVFIGPGCVIKDCVIGSGTEIAAHSVLHDALIGEQCRIGPFARIRPGTTLGEGVRIGNFVETKEAHFAPGSKANHLSYVGDAEVGRDVNIGAGTITCNYDGAHKHRTIIGDGAFIGSGTELVAPIEIGAGATVGAGSTLTKDAPADQLTVARPKQNTVAGWRRPRKDED
jgi:bifunctional UDP-N-acetylglucosamine pyrophosphorylase / glucosamine-1-phosphate N-acetyltransferase